MDDVVKVKLFVLRDLVKSRVFGGKHTPLLRIVNQLPDDFQKDKHGQKTIQKAIKDLVNNEWLLAMKKRTGKCSDVHVSINPRRIRDVSDFILKQSGQQ